MFCPYCGTELNQAQQYCVNCGRSLSPTSNSSTPSLPSDIIDPTPASKGEKILFGIISFFIPIAGIIFYILWKDVSPDKAKVCITAALVQIILSFVVAIVATMISVFGFLALSDLHHLT